MVKTKPIPELNEKTIAAFWSKINITENSQECCEWQGSKDSCGYGRFNIKGSIFSAHRIAYFLANGDAGDLSVLHHCDNPACCQNSHFFLGNQFDNMQDRSKKGRGNHPTGERHGTKTKPESVARGERSGHYTKPECMPKGERMGTAKLTDIQVLDIRDMCRKGDKTYIQIASIFNVSTTVISGIAKGKGWKHLPVGKKASKRIGGSDNWTAKLTDKKVLKIRELYDGKEYTYSSLSKQFKIGKHAIACIITGKTWKHLSLGNKRDSVRFDNNKLKEDQVVKMREQYNKENKTVKELAGVFNMSISAVYKIVINETWKYLLPQTG